MLRVVSELPRFAGPAQARQRMRLAAAIGMLAIAAIATGGLASLAAGSPMLRDRGETKAGSPPPAPAPELDPATLAEQRVREAELAAARARAALGAARRAEHVDPATIEELERRVERLGERPLSPLGDASAQTGEREPTGSTQDPREL